MPATKLQAPMPLPLLALPIEGSGAYATNYNTAPAGTAGDLPLGWSSAATNGPFGLYANFTFQDRQNAFWVYRGLNSGLPPLAAGTYNAVSGAFGPLVPATAVSNLPFAYYLHVSRVVSSMTVNNSPTLPAGLSASVTTNGIAILGTPLVTGSNTYQITIQDLADNSEVTNSLSIKVVSSGVPFGQSPLIDRQHQSVFGNECRLRRPASVPGRAGRAEQQFHDEILLRESGGLRLAGLYRAGGGGDCAVPPAKGGP